jgi:hypothetical protein
MARSSGTRQCHRGKERSHRWRSHPPAASDHTVATQHSAPAGNGMGTSSRAWDGLTRSTIGSAELPRQASLSSMRVFAPAVAAAPVARRNSTTRSRHNYRTAYATDSARRPSARASPEVVRNSQARTPGRRPQDRSQVRHIQIGRLTVSAIARSTPTRHHRQSPATTTSRLSNARHSRGQPPDARGGYRACSSTQAIPSRSAAATTCVRQCPLVPAT